MIKCNKCKKKMFIDRVFTTPQNIEVFCLYCGSRKFYNPPTASSEGRWLLQKENLRVKNTTSRL